MIDTDKYEGHTPAPWWMPSMELRGSSHPVVKMAIFKREPSLADRFLITDAPLLLEAYKRLREEKEMLLEELKNDDTGIKAIDGLLKAVKDRNEEVKQLREENKKQLDVLSTLDEMIRNEESHVEMMKALEQGLELPETWKEMIE